MKRSLRLMVLTLAAAPLFARAAPIALASCVGVPVSIGEAIRTAPVVFVGSVTSTTDSGRTATVHVDELWRGPTLPAEVTLHGSPGASAAATSVDRHYVNGGRYLFVPASGNGPGFDDNACSQTREFGPDLVVYRPAEAQRYPALISRPPLLRYAAVGGLLIAALAALITVWRAPWRASPHSPGREP
ncbi:MAG: hypothetical protein ACYDGR_17330 [Candidatus Dormibacteria bacterium]